MALVDLIQAVTGGRPMTLLKPAVLEDESNHKPINLYQDHKGRRWIAQNRWGTIRERVPESVTFNVIYGEETHVRK